jgi:hypothetical protein
LCVVQLYCTQVNEDRGLSPSQVEANLKKFGPNGKLLKIPSSSSSLLGSCTLFLGLIDLVSSILYCVSTSKV